MKSLIFLLFLSLTLLGSVSAQQSMPVPDQTEQVTQTQTKQSFFEKVKDKVKDGAINIGIGLIVGLFAKNGWTLLIKKIAGKASVITKEIGETFIGGSNFFRVLEHSIRSDGKLEENSIKEVLAAGKEVIAEANDVIISIKPKLAVT